MPSATSDLSIHVHRPHHALRERVVSICVVRANRLLQPPLLRTAPSPLPILSVNFADLTRTAAGVLHPRLALLGPQRSARSWLPPAACVFVMAFLSPWGAAEMFGSDAAQTVDRLVDLADLVGPADLAPLRGLAHASDRGMCEGLEQWLLVRFEASPLATRLRQVCAEASAPLGGLAGRMGVSTRTLQREISKQLGLSLVEYRMLCRVHDSVRSAQDPNGAANPRDGFADQAHQIRSWKSRSLPTPGAYARRGPSLAARAWSQAGRTEQEHPAFWL